LLKSEDLLKNDFLAFVKSYSLSSNIFYSFPALFDVLYEEIAHFLRIAILFGA